MSPSRRSNDSRAWACTRHNKPDSAREVTTLLLRRLLSGLAFECDESDDVEISDIAYDSRQVRPGTLFVAVPRVGADDLSGGYEHLDAAVAAGAAAVVVQAGETPTGIPSIRVPDTRRALAELAAEFFGHPSRNLCLCGVTGTDGKTTTTYLLEQIFAEAGHQTGLIGTVETKLGAERRTNTDRVTTPESLDLQRLLRDMVQVGVTHVAMEVSSHALALDRVRGCHFTAAGLTNITADHIEFHGSWEEYFRLKSTLFTQYSLDSAPVLNRDDANFARLAGLLARDPFTYALNSDADLVASRLEPDWDGTRCELSTVNERVGTTIPMPGTFNVANALAAVALALQSGLSLSVAARGLASADPPPGRMQRIDVGQPFTVLVDYAHTTNAFHSVLSALYHSNRIIRQGGEHGRIIAVFGAAGNRDRAKRPILAQLALQYTDYFYITNEDPFGESAEAIMAEVAAGVDPAERGRRYELEPDRGIAINRALDRARPGDIIIVTGKGHEQSMVVNGQKQPWSDAAAIRSALGITV